MRNGTGQSLAEKIVFGLLYFLADVISIFLVVNVIKNNPDSASAAISSVCYVIAAALFVGAVAVVHSSRTNKFKELKNIEKTIEQLNSMVILWDTSFSYVRANNAFIRTTGYSEEELTDPEVLKNVLPPDAFSENLQSIINSRDEEFIIRTRNGSSVCTVWNTSVVSSIFRRGITGKEEFSILMSIGPNLTETNRMKQEVIAASRKLRESEKRYELSMDLSEIGLILKEHGSSRFYVSDQLCEMLGIVSEGGYASGETIRETFHPKDRVVFDTFASGMKNAAEDLSRNEIHSVDFRAKA
ncbi:MAG: PAS domain S-box protein, partial [Huintestinicola sp.]